MERDIVADEEPPCLSILHRSSITEYVKKREPRREGGACRSLLVLQFDFKNEVEGKVCGADERPCVRYMHRPASRQHTNAREELSCRGEGRAELNCPCQKERKLTLAVTLRLRSRGDQSETAEKTWRKIKLVLLTRLEL